MITIQMYPNLFNLLLFFSFVSVFILGVVTENNENDSTKMPLFIIAIGIAVTMCLLNFFVR